MTRPQVNSTNVFRRYGQDRTLHFYQIFFVEGVRIPLYTFKQKRKNHPFGWFLFLAESKGFDGLCPSFALRTPDYVRLRRGGSNPPLHIQTKKKKPPFGVVSLFGGEQGIRTLETVLAVYTISNRAPSTSSDNSPYLCNCLAIIQNISQKIKCYFIKYVLLH